MKDLNEQEKFWLREGPAYTDRNCDTDAKRLENRAKFFDLFQSIDDGNKDLSILEVGCNSGQNLGALHILGYKNLSGIDIVEHAVKKCQAKLPDADIRLGSILDLPFEDNAFDIVFSAGVLIHQHRTESLPVVMKEMDRCSKRNIIGFEGYAPITTTADYRWQKDQYWGAPYARLWKEFNEDFVLARRQMLGNAVIYRIDK
tara:strand:- start:1112 stop:1714 length:603 start_codon:yes stop_codon:yes gene_type:complete